MTTSTDTPADAATDAPGVPVPDRIAAVDAQLDQLDAQAAADPVTGAADLDKWRARDAARRDRAAQLVQRRRDLAEYGSLLDEHDAAVRGYLAVAGPLRARYEPLAEARVFPMHRESVPSQYRDAPKELRRWAEALGALGRAVPAGHDDGRVFLAREWTRWLGARDGWLRALVALDGRGLVPCPEVGEGAAFPPGIGAGVHLLDDPHAVQVPYKAPTAPQVQSLEDSARAEAAPERLRPGGLRS